MEVGQLGSDERGHQHSCRQDGGRPPSVGSSYASHGEGFGSWECTGRLSPGLALRQSPFVGFSEKILLPPSLTAWRESIRQSGRQLVVTNGCFDLLHIGHATYLEAARALGDLLLVGVNSDASVRRLKGSSRPIRVEGDRAALIAALGCVDAVCVFDETSAERFLGLAQPDVWAKGADYTLETLNQAERTTVEKGGGRIAFLPLVPGRSTTLTLKRLEEVAQQ